ncbi:PAS domain S-box protein [Geomonas sp. Red32]|uniref:hybrid sensor histidine kinase/response regulator n=1 Tax=Geomonas sp. Red32 TaxID=2912856 RepID=UPI00202CD381|nr:hybrid sensor histidine kinase/response regulator [Geomonas sp. Red32]MCM0081438.1 PAS domain S-box protein [Geomonas sp. Red32]
MKILVVDDNANDRRGLRYYLENRGEVTVIEARDGREGYDVALEQLPDLIISDALMPQMDGFEFLRNVKINDLLKKIPFVFYSAVYTGSKDEEFARKLGADAFITKPKEPEEFWQEILAALNRRGGGEKESGGATPLGEESEYLKGYSTVVAAKLEEKVLELEDSLALRLEAEEALRKSEQFLSSIFENIPDMILVEDAVQGTILRVNRAGEELLGYSREKLVGCKPSEVLPAELARYFARLAEDPPPAGSVVEMPEQTIATRYRGDRVIGGKKISILDQADQTTYILGICEDVTERTRAEEELRKLSSAIRQSPVSIMIANTDGIIEFVNPKFYQVTGLTPAETLGQNTRIMKSGKTPDEEYRRLWSTITSGRVWHGEFHNHKKDGDYFWEQATIAPVKNREGEITHFIAIKEDVTERKRLEEQLRQAQKMEAIGKLAGGVAHDFNNMLMVIFGYANIVQMKMADDDPLKENMDKLLSAADRAATLTRSLLAFSRKEPMVLRPLNFNEVVRKVEKFLSRIIGEDVTVCTEFREDPLPVNADGGQIEQVLMNLATNARDAMPTGGTLTISTEGVELSSDETEGKGGRYVVISVSDNGIGMDSETAERIFDPFFTTKEAGKGTGLGLSIVYGIVKQHDGFITVNSEPGRGTTFRIHLPRLTAGEESAEESAAAASAPEGSETVLLAEDDAEVRRLAVSVLTQFGYQVIEAWDGVEAVNLFREHQEKIALVMLDLIMPRMGGKEAFAEIRTMSREVPVLFVSGYPRDVVQRSGMIEENFDLLMKPITPQGLLVKIRELLDRAKAGA